MLRAYPWHLQVIGDFLQASLERFATLHQVLEEVEQILSVRRAETACRCGGDGAP